MKNYILLKMREINNIYVKRLINDLKNMNISFSFDKDITTGHNGEMRNLDNVVFEKNGVVYKVYGGIFFRDFGPPIDDKIFYDIQKLNVINFFKNFR